MQLLLQMSIRSRLLALLFDATIADPDSGRTVARENVTI